MPSARSYSDVAVKSPVRVAFALTERRDEGRRGDDGLDESTAVVSEA